MIYLLPSDYVMWAVFFGLIFVVRKVYKNQMAQDFCRQLLKSASACVSLIIMLFFFLVALSDSLHYETKGNSYTGLDMILSPIGMRDEVTFSQPFSTKLFVHKTEFYDGHAVRTKPKLNSVTGRSTQENALSILFDLGMAFSLVSIIAFAFIFRKAKTNNISFMKCVNLLSEPDEISYKAIYFTLLALCFLVTFMFDFSGYYYLAGTDKIGSEILYLCLKSIRTGITLGITTIVFMLPLATLFGISAGYFGGKVDSVIQYVYTTLSSIPGVLLIAASVLSLNIFMYQHSAWFSSMAMRADLRLVALCFILGVTGWISLCRLLRGEVLKLRELDFIVHAKVVGMHPFKIMYKHILPNVMHIVIITTVLDFSGLVLAEAVLSYLGVGVDPTMHSWGNMINSARLELSREPVVWWPLLCAIAFMLMLVLSVNILSDKIRNLHDPRRL